VQGFGQRAAHRAVAVKTDIAREAADGRGGDLAAFGHLLDLERGAAHRVAHQVIRNAAVGGGALGAHARQHLAQRRVDERDVRRNRNTCRHTALDF
jgi:hypothetical protein